MNILIVIDGLGVGTGGGTTGTLQALLPHIESQHTNDSRVLRSLKATIETASPTARTIATGYSGADSYLGHFEMMGIRAYRKETFVENARETIVDIFGRGDFRDWGYSNGEVIISNNIEADLGSTVNIITSLQHYKRVQEKATILRRQVDANRVIVMASRSVTIRSHDWIAPGISERHMHNPDAKICGLVPARLGLYDESYLCRHIGRGFYEYTENQRAKSYLDTIISDKAPFVLMGKVCDIFDLHQQAYPFGRFYNTTNISELQQNAQREIADRKNVFIFMNFQDIDIQCHSRNIKQAALALLETARALDTLLKFIQDDDTLIITADHGNNPETEGNSHTFEDVPIVLHTTAPTEEIQRLKDISTFLRDKTPLPSHNPRHDQRPTNQCR